MFFLILAGTFLWWFIGFASILMSGLEPDQIGEIKWWKTLIIGGPGLILHHFLYQLSKTIDQKYRSWLLK